MSRSNLSSGRGLTTEAFSFSSTAKLLNDRHIDENDAATEDEVLSVVSTDSDRTLEGDGIVSPTSFLAGHNADSL